MIGVIVSLVFYEVKFLMDVCSYDDLILEDGNGCFVILVKCLVLSGEYIVNVCVGVDNMGMFEVNILLDYVGGKIMSDFFGKYIGKLMVIVYCEYKINVCGEIVCSEKVISVVII